MAVKGGTPDVAVFSGSYVNKVDRKGRVSVPAPFRAVLNGQGLQGIAAFPTPSGSRSLDCCGLDWLNQLSDRFASGGLYQPELDMAALLTLGAAQQLPFDGEGRILLPQPLVAHAGIEEAAAFVGLGRRFQIWAPHSLKAAVEEARSRAPAVLAQLNLPPLPGGARTP
jgi:MraZ protein